MTRKDKNELRSMIVQKLMSAKTEADLESVSELVDDAVIMRVMTRKEANALFDELAPEVTA